MTIRNDFITGLIVLISIIISSILFIILYWCIIFGGGFVIALIIGIGSWIIPYAWSVFILTLFGFITFVGDVCKYIVKGDKK